MKYIIAFLISFPVLAAPIAVVTKNDISVILTNEPCQLKDVKNLPYRAIWREPGLEVEGCFSVFPGPSIGLYFKDKTVGVVPAQEFSKVTEI